MLHVNITSREDVRYIQLKVCNIIHVHCIALSIIRIFNCVMYMYMHFWNFIQWEIILDRNSNQYAYINSSQRPFCTSSWWGVNSQVGDCLVGLCHWVEGHWLKNLPVCYSLYNVGIREVERLTRNPEKLANADGRFWKDTLGRKRSFETHRPTYPTRRGLVTAWQETKKLLHDESGRTMSGRTRRRKISENYQDW